MYKRTLIIFLVCLLFVSAGCKKKHQTVGDELLQDTSVTSVIAVNDPGISAGNEAFLRGDFTAAIAFYETGLRQNRAVAFYNMGVSHYMTHNIREAERYFRLAIDEDPTFDEAILNLVAVLAEQGRPAEAEQYISRLIDTKKTARVFVDMANLALRNGSSARATFYYTRALQIDSESSFVLSNYANFLIGIGEFEEGRKILESLPERDFTTNYNLALISWLQRNTGTAFDFAMQAFYSRGESELGLDKLAQLFNNLRRYSNESETLRKLIGWNPKREYRLRLTYSYLLGWELDKAADEVNYILADYPGDIDAIVMRYDIMIAGGQVTNAGDFIKGEFHKTPSERLRYQVVRHISLYERDLTQARQLVSINSDSPYINLARTAYNISADNLQAAEQALDRVPEGIINDYYIFRSFMLFKNKRLREAAEVAEKISRTKPEHFWYPFVFAWNLRQPERILELISEYRGNSIVSVRIPNLRYYLNPVAEDIEFVSRFDNRGKDISSILLYPFFIEPDDMFPFVALGYKLLRESEPQAAITELQLSIDHSVAVAKNNEAVVDLLNFRYNAALTKFRLAEEKLTLDPFLQYNIGLALLLSGDTQAGLERFQRAIRLNRYFVPAYVGAGLAKLKLAQPDEARVLLEAAVSNANEYEVMEHETPVLTMIIRAKYLALLALEQPERVFTTASDTQKDEFVDAMLVIAQYILQPTQERLNPIRGSNIYKMRDLVHLIDMSIVPAGNMREQNFGSRNTLMAGKYVTATRGRFFTEEFLQPHMREPTVLIDLVNLSTLLHKKADGLKYLQALSRQDIHYPLQYKASLFYFIWSRDFINAEASYATLERLGYSDRLVRYYMMLYFLINTNPVRFEAQVNDYVQSFPNDHRSLLMRSMLNFEQSNIPVFLSGIETLLAAEPFVFNKMPLELDLERF